MNKRLLTFALFLLWLGAGAQFINEGKQWNVRQELNFGPITTAIYKLGGDTVINALSYKKVWINLDSASNTWYNEGFLREESNRVYFRQYDMDGLLYDFNLGVGDTVYVISRECWEPVEKVVYSVDSVEINGISRTQWNFDDIDWDFWIEGIGSAFGPLNSIFPCYTDFYVDLLCYYENDSLLFMKNWWEGCYVTNVGLDEIPIQHTLAIAPNPSGHGSPVELSSTGLFTDLDILDVKGALIRSYRNMNARSVTLDLDFLDPGIYLVKVRMDNGQFNLYKLVRL